jgi:hypothetical protein
MAMDQNSSKLVNIKIAGALSPKNINNGNIGVDTSPHVYVCTRIQGYKLYIHMHMYICTRTYTFMDCTYV